MIDTVRESLGLFQGRGISGRVGAGDLRVIGATWAALAIGTGRFRALGFEIEGSCEKRNLVARTPTGVWAMEDRNE
jgi:hypothetical protein